MISAVENQKIIKESKRLFVGQGFSLLLLELLDKSLLQTEQSMNLKDDSISPVKGEVQDSNPDIWTSGAMISDKDSKGGTDPDLIAYGNKEKKETNFSQNFTKGQKTHFPLQDAQTVTFFLRHEKLLNEHTNSRISDDEIEVWHRQFVEGLQEHSKVKEDKVKGVNTQENVVKKLSVTQKDKPMQQIKIKNEIEKKNYTAKTGDKSLGKALDLKELLSSDKQIVLKGKNLPSITQKQIHKELNLHLQNSKEMILKSKEYAQIRIRKIHTSTEKQISDQKKNFLHIQDTGIIKKEDSESPPKAHIRGIRQVNTKKNFILLTSGDEKQSRQNTGLEDLNNPNKMILHNSLIKKEDSIYQEKLVFRVNPATNDSQNNNHIYKVDLINKLADVIHYTAKSHKKEELIVHLKPEFLGKLKIKLAFEDGHLRIELFTESHLVKEALTSHVSVLQRILLDKGIPVQEIEIFLSWQGSQNDRRFTKNKFRPSHWKVDSFEEDIVSPSSHKKNWELEDGEGLEYWA